MATLDELRDALNGLAEGADASAADPSRAYREARETVAGRRHRRPVLLAAAAVVALLVATVGFVVTSSGGEDGTDLITESPSTTVSASTTESPSTTEAPNPRPAGPRVVVSPLVEISGYLTDMADEEIFSVAVSEDDQSDYLRAGGVWRLMALTDFDGGIWRDSGDFEPVTGPVESDVDGDVPRRFVRQTITTSALSNIYLPAVYEVSEVIDSGGVSLEYQQETGALAVAADSQEEFTYTVESAVPIFGIDRPDRAAEGLDPGFVEKHTALPSEWPASLTGFAEEITAGADRDVDRALFLGAHFQYANPGSYAYDPGVPADHGIESIERLLETRRGQSEQFASAFAALARSLGMPARVAVGFTEGEWGDERQEFVVRGEHAYAWPEIYFAGHGWIAYDATPARTGPGSLPPPLPSDPDTFDVSAEVINVDLGSFRAGGVATEAGSVWSYVRNESFSPSDDGSNAVVRLDPRTGEVQARIELPNGESPRDVIVGGGMVWVPTDSLVYRIDPATDTVVETVAGTGGGGGAASSDAVWVMPPGCGMRCRFQMLQRIDPAAPDNVAFVPVENAEGQVPIAIGHGAVWVGVEGRVDRIDPTTNEIVATIETSSGNDIVVTDDAVWTVGREVVTRIDPDTNAVVATIVVPAAQGAVVVDEYLLVGAGASILFRIDARTNTTDAVFALGSDTTRPAHLTVADDHLWFNVWEGFGYSDSFYATSLGRIPLDAVLPAPGDG